MSVKSKVIIPNRGNLKTSEDGEVSAIKKCVA